MDDIVIPSTIAYGPFKPDRPPYASSAEPRTFGQLQPQKQGAVPAGFVTPAKAPRAAASACPTTITGIVLKSGETFHVIKYRVDGSALTFEQLNGAHSPPPMRRRFICT